MAQLHIPAHVAALDKIRRILETIDMGNKTEAVKILQRILAMPSLESRHYLQAWQFLRGLGVQPGTAEAKRLYGMIVEVALQNGLDIVAAYADHQARYFNYSGAAVVWERPAGHVQSRLPNWQSHPSIRPSTRFASGRGSGLLAMRICPTLLRYPHPE